VSVGRMFTAALTPVTAFSWWAKRLASSASL
jgi:hypothetical protein